MKAEVQNSISVLRLNFGSKLNYLFRIRFTRCLCVCHNKCVYGRNLYNVLLYSTFGLIFSSLGSDNPLFLLSRKLPQLFRKFPQLSRKFPQLFRKFPLRRRKFPLRRRKFPLRWRKFPLRRRKFPLRRRKFPLR